MAQARKSNISQSAEKVKKTEVTGIKVKPLDLNRMAEAEPNIPFEMSDDGVAKYQS